MQFDIKKYLPQLTAIGIFIVISFIFCYPQLQGKILSQSDTIQWKAMSEEARAYYEKTGENTLWSNSMFGGMPTYTFYAPENDNYIAKIHQAVLGVFGMPASMFFIALVCFYILLRSLKVNQWLAIAGAIAYAFATFNIQSIVAGHNTKVFCIGYMPGMLAGLIYIYNKDWWRGIPLLGITLCLMITAGHYQIVYYTIIMVMFIVLAMLIIAVKNGTLKDFIISSFIALGTIVLAVGPSLQLVFATMEYNKTTMRGGQSELTIVKHDEGKKSGGLDKDYAFRWSNGLGETLCFMIPYLYGGSVDEPLESAPKFEEVTGGQASRAPLYWGPQPFVYGPIYLGAIICFLFVLGLIIVKSPHKWWIAVLTLLSVAMSCGKHLPAFNYFLFDTLPMFNKFRTPTMAMAIAQVLVPLLAIWGLQEIIYGKQSKDELLKKLKLAAGITAGICVLMGVAGNMFFDFTGGNDGTFPAEYKQRLVDALREDRQALAMKSSFTSAVYILLAAGLIWAYLKDKITNVKMVAAGVAILVAVDLLSVAAHYMKEEAYMDPSDEEAYFQPRPVDEQIKQDKDPYYRVLDLSVDVYNNAIQAYHHKCVGGYSPAKMEQYQDLIDVHMSGSFNAQVLNMLNTKYIIYKNGEQVLASANPDACGNAWFVDEVKWANTADDEIKALDAGKLGDTVIVPNAFNPKKTAVMRAKFQSEMNGYSFGKDSTARIVLTKYGLNGLSFESKNSKNGLALFSDMYYPYGWKALVDGKETPIMKANYVLRAIKVPAGEHKIEFVFHPDTFYNGDKIALLSSLLLIGLTGFSLFRLTRKKTGEA